MTCLAMFHLDAMFVCKNISSCHIMSRLACVTDLIFTHKLQILHVSRRCTMCIPVYQVCCINISKETPDTGLKNMDNPFTSNPTHFRKQPGLPGNASHAVHYRPMSSIISNKLFRSVEFSIPHNSYCFFHQQIY